MPPALGIQNRVDQRRAFTRTDLLTLIVIVTALSLLQARSFAAGRQAGHALVCLNNVKQLMRGWLGFSEDHTGYFPVNVDDGGSSNWVAGIVVNANAATNTTVLTNSQIAPYLGGKFQAFRCPDDPFQFNGVPRVRSYSANQAVGTKQDGKTPVDGPWLDGNHNNRANNPWRTYANLHDMIAPKPSNLWVIIDEDEYSINDAGFAVSMVGSQMIDWPSTRHNFSGTFSFADGHGEIHRWKDPRTKVIKGDVSRVNQPNNPDILWLQQRTSARAN